MVQYIPPPDPRTLLPPFLACLPTAFASPRPPPALLPLLSPILQQRIHLLSPTQTSTSDGWLSLLCWDATRAEELTTIIESEAFELHPVSGEIEYRDIDGIKYRRLDEETLQARVDISHLRLVFIYLWCKGDEGGGKSGWRVAEVNPTEVDSEVSGNLWWTTIGEANGKAQEAVISDALGQYAHSNHKMPTDAPTQEDEDDDGDYWAQYDNDPGRTPAKSLSPLNERASNVDRDLDATSESDYYAQYAHVQPALDNDDPSKSLEMNGPSTLNGSAIISAMEKPISNQVTELSASRVVENRIEGPAIVSEISHPRPSSSSSNASSAIIRLETSAASQSHMERSVQQHISTSIKSLYRLASSAGIEKEEFVRVIRTELDTLNMWSEDD